MTPLDLATYSIEAFEHGDIEGGGFSHEAHVYVGWLYLNRFPVNEAITRFTAALRRLTAKLGVPDKYHGTITWFFLLIIADRRNSGGSWSTFRQANADLFNRDDNILHRYYSRELLDSDEARQRFVLPDRLAP